VEVVRAWVRREAGLCARALGAGVQAIGSPFAR